MAIDMLWRNYKETKDLSYKQVLIEKYIQLVKIVAGRMYNFYGGNVEYEDLVGFGIFGLIDAIDKFDINRDLKFETYAQIRIRGAIIDNLRKLDWIPRGLRKKAKEMERAINILENRLGRSATTKEIAFELKTTETEVESILSEISTLNIVSLEEALINKGETYDNLSDLDSPERIFENKELKFLLKEAIENLTEKEKIVISLYYYEGLTYKEIASVLEVSESRISQLHSKAILSLKNLLASKGII
ncbi:RNA polymerase sigma factor for flagellar operon FliA [Proteiniborus sp. DW1]|uniref:FliA/WhiG family RNA polymerase sigma factor n=1 Tax=Proteiniborus sp. DW1 TaxID=1889883 RepID=UPI00092DFBA0|nr:FliA/WhiG family RNA polymerase sigma factor [Proteiniborus sp. DW1]SCG83423.1 RNA polymerase sigma factor for flagellar operon FliA [Proteiniborus sp. DW1]